MPPISCSPFIHTFRAISSLSPFGKKHMPSNTAGGSSSGVSKTPGYVNRDTAASRVPQGNRIRKRFASSRQYLAAINTGKKKGSSYTYAQLKQAQQSTQRKQHYNGGIKKRTSTTFISPDSRNGGYTKKQHTTFTSTAGEYQFDEDASVPYFHNSSSLNTPSKSILKSKSSYAKPRPSTSVPCSSVYDSKKSKPDAKVVTTCKPGDQAGPSVPKTLQKNKPRLRWWDGVPSRNGKPTDISKNTHNTAVLQENEPNISDTTGACKSLKSQATYSLSHGVNKAAESTTPSTAAKHIVGVDERPPPLYQPLPGNLVSSPSSFSPHLCAKENSSNEPIRMSLFQSIESSNSAAEQNDDGGHRPSATSVHSVRNEGVGEIEKGTNDDSKQLPKEESKKSRKKVTKKEDSGTPSSRAAISSNEKAQSLKKRTQQLEICRRYRRRPVRQSRSINPNDKWKHLGLHPRETMNILTNGMSIKNIKKRERKAKRRKQKVQADQEPCKLTRRSKRKRETAMQVEGTPMPRKRQVTKAAQRSETRNRTTRRKIPPTNGNSKSSNVSETKTKNQTSERAKRVQRRNRLLEEHMQKTKETVEEIEETAQDNQCHLVSIKEDTSEQMEASTVGNVKENTIIAAAACKTPGADTERRLMGLEDKCRIIGKTDTGEESNENPSFEKSAMAEVEKEIDAVSVSGQYNCDEAYSPAKEDDDDDIGGVGEQLVQTSETRTSKLHDDRFGYTYNIIVPIGVQSLGILVGDLKLFGSAYVEVDSVVLDGYAMRTGLCQKGDVLLSVEDHSGNMIDLRGMQVVQSFPYITSKHRPLRLKL